MRANRVHVRFTKYDGSLHWHYDATDLGEDEHGRWFTLGPGSPYRRGDEAPRRAVYGFVGVVPPDTWWSAEFNPVPIGGSFIYVNVNTPATWDGDRVSLIDLDLDVVLGSDGEVGLLDEDEFTDHTSAMAYPEHIVDRARAAAAEAFLALEQRREPFAAAGRRHLAATLGWSHGRVVEGHGVASGRSGDDRFPNGTLSSQVPVFAARGLDLTGLHPATINVDVTPLRLEPLAPRHTFEDVSWHEEAPPETFSFFDARLATAAGVHEAMVYLPHPETKPAHPQPETIVEVLAPKIEGLGPGSLVSLWVALQQGKLK